MRKANVVLKLGSWRWIHRFILIVGTLAILICIATLSKAYSLRFLLVTDSSSSCYSNSFTTHGSTAGEIKATVELVVDKIQQEIDGMRDSPHESSSSELKHASFLADILGLIESVQASLSRTEGIPEHNGVAVHPISRPNQGTEEPAEYFLTEEIRKYVRSKPNRLKKQNFMGANGTFTSIRTCMLFEEKRARRVHGVRYRRYM
ncbi:S-adenosyl-L-methionine-dependent methyltransferase superfamily protein [Forsythia ovata]|uniref:S-adenosyl-L-methionine-dependent methyltransferase superfamily protein n=1 Tax=Forsythia ovata TaxID=205694 RepID=A0ABD1QR77_9LAMI